jgi:hypothetical protein
MFQYFAAVNAYPGAFFRAFDAAGQLHLGHRCDGAEGLPAKTQGGDGVQIAGVVDLAGGVPLKCQGAVLRLDPAPIVRNPDLFDAAALDLDGDHGGAGIDGVFDKLFDDGNGAFNDFTSGDPVRGESIQYVDLHKSFLIAVLRR